MKRHRPWVCLLFLLSACSATAEPVASNAAAPPVASNEPAVPSEVRDAQILFDDARRLMAEGKYDLACPKLEESRRLDPAGGTAINLGLCFEAQGKTASAIAAFNEAVAFAYHDKRPGRVRFAREHIAKLELRPQE